MMRTPKLLLQSASAVRVHARHHEDDVFPIGLTMAGSTVVAGTGESAGPVFVSVNLTLNEAGVIAREILAALGGEPSDR